MIEIQRSLLLQQPIKKVFDLVSHFEEYPKFLPYCIAAKRLTSPSFKQPKDQMHYVEGELTIQWSGLTYVVSTQNTVTPYSEIILSMLNGPFRSFKGHWQFNELRTDATEIIFHVQCQPLNRLMRWATQKTITTSIDQVIIAFQKRLYQSHPELSS